MGGQFLILVDHERPLEKIARYLGHVYIEPSSLESAIRFIRTNFLASEIYVNAVTFSSKEAVDILDTGASKIIISRCQFEDIQKDALLLDLKRIIVSFEGPLSTVQHDIKAVTDLSSDIGVYLSGVETVKSLGDLKLPHSKVYVAPKEIKEVAVRDIITAGLAPVIPFSSLNADANTVPNAISLSALITSILKSDRPDGLYPTIVSNERGISLGLVYSNTESIVESLKTGRGVYHSRQRGLWYKGETSGDVQELLRIDLDCDGDTLLYTVRQKGNGKTCIVCRVRANSSRLLPFENRNLFR